MSKFVDQMEKCKMKDKNVEEPFHVRTIFYFFCLDFEILIKIVK